MLVLNMELLSITTLRNSVGKGLAGAVIRKTYFYLCYGYGRGQIREDPNVFGCDAVTLYELISTFETFQEQFSLYYSPLLFPC